MQDRKNLFCHPTRPLRGVQLTARNEYKYHSIFVLHKTSLIVSVNSFIPLDRENDLKTIKNQQFGGRKRV